MCYNGYNISGEERISIIDLYNVHNSDYIYNLMDVAILVCRAWGNELGKQRHEEDDYSHSAFAGDYDTHIYYSVNYEYDNDKVHICATDVGGRKKDCDYKVVITIKAIQEEVLNVKYPKLYAYRPGKWEQYLFSMQKDAELAIRHKTQIEARIRAQKQKERAEREKKKFEPIDDSDLF